jgi:hypothetical protein
VYLVTTTLSEEYPGFPTELKLISTKLSPTPVTVTVALPELTFKPDPE